MVFGIIPECRSASRRNGCSPSSESPKSSAHRLRVRQFTVPELLLALGWEGIDVLKIDIEGYEKTLFHGNNAWLSRVRWIIEEAAHGHVNYSIDDVRADLAPFGFKVRQKSFDTNNRLTIFEARNASA